MKRAIFVMTLCAGATALIGCGGSAPAPAAPEAKPAAPAAPAAAPAAPTAPAAASEAPAAPAEAPKQPDTAVTPEPAAANVDPAVQKLIGTTWSMPDGTELTFKDDKNVQAKGGKVAMLGPNGINVTFTYNAGNLEFKAMGQTLTGTWDGEKLTVSGGEGTKKAQ